MLGLAWLAIFLVTNICVNVFLAIRAVAVFKL